MCVCVCVGRSYFEDVSRMRMTAAYLFTPSSILSLQTEEHIVYMKLGEKKAYFSHTRCTLFAVFPAVFFFFSLCAFVNEVSQPDRAIHNKARMAIWQSV